MDYLKSKGACSFCDRILSKRGIGRHLSKHLAEEEKPGGKRFFHLRVENGPYFLNLLVHETNTLYELDQFLRAIWLECCGHLSQFSIGRPWEALSMDLAAGTIFKKGAALFYEYDFGSTTELTVKVVGKHRLDMEPGFWLISRNEPLEIWCQSCGKQPATTYPTDHYETDGPAFFCDDCFEQHLSEDMIDEEATLPVVNSPRMGVCGYMGGTFDEERDGVFQMT